MASTIPQVSDPSEDTLLGVRTLLAEIAHLCALANVSESDVLPIFSEAFRAASRVRGYLLHDRADPVFASQVLTHWHDSEAFLDTDGSPRKLSLAVHEFEELCAAAGDRSRASSALNLLLASGAVCQHADMLSAVRRDVIVGQSLRSSVDLGIRLCGEFARTLNYNQTRSGDAPRLFERTALSTRFAPRHVPALLAYLSLHAEGFLEDIDNWMKARDSDSDSMTVGVGVHLFLSNEKTFPT
jgi:hypothetical protein